VTTPADAFDEPARLSLPVPPPAAGLTRRPPRHRRGERFLKGPIPWPWISAAAALPGKALHGMALP
jgi:hypothetical protein